MGKLNQAIKKMMLQLIEYRDNYNRTKGLYNEIEERKLYWEQVKLSDDQIHEIEAIYGIGFDVRWHRFYQYYTGKFDPAYLPIPVFSPKMEKRMNPRHIALEMEDKIRIPLVYGNINGLHIPETVVSNASGIFYDNNGMVLSKEDADQRVRSYLEVHESAIIKPIRNSYGGKDIYLLTRENFTGIEYEKNFIVQERIVNQEDIRVLNPSSLNTMRVITYICNNQYWTAPIALRLGATSALTDNISGGGLCIGVEDDGRLCSCAFAEEIGEKYLEHPVSKIQFGGYQLKNVDKVIHAAIECHKRTPHLVMASWDMTLNHKGEPVLIEGNFTSQSVGFPQYTHGKALFGNNTKEMLKYLQD